MNESSNAFTEHLSDLPVVIPELLQDSRDLLASIKNELTEEEQQYLNLSFEEVRHLPDKALASKIALCRWQEAEACKERDPMTNMLKNRDIFIEFGGKILSELARYEPSPMATVLSIDLNNFKRVNDSLGHDKGDELLKQFSKAIKDSIRKNDLPARLGGDEFALLLPGADSEGAKVVTQRVIKAIKPIFYSNVFSQCALATAIGMQQILGIDHLLKKEGDSLESAIKSALEQADIASYVAKKEIKEIHPEDWAPVLYKNGMKLPKSTNLR